MAILGLGSCRFSASFFDDVADGIRRLGPLGDPVFGLVDIKREVHTILHGIVGSNLLDVAAITALTAVDSNDLVERTILGALAVESESKHNSLGKKSVCLM